MDEKTLRAQVAETGRLLLEKRLVARTWGNFSARLDETHFVITPSGLGYEQMIADDMVRFCIADETWEGTRKPSSEKGIHAAAYRLFPEVGFVIHTHQAYATALGLTEHGQLGLTEEEREALGGVAWAEYGLPGTKKLREAVAAALIQPQRRYEPNAENRAVYERNYRVFRRLYESNKKNFALLNGAEE